MSILVPALIAVGGSIGLIVWLVFTNLDDRALARSSLRQLDGQIEVDNLRERQLLDPLRDRAITPVLRRVDPCRATVHACRVRRRREAQVSPSQVGAAATRSTAFSLFGS